MNSSEGEKNQNISPDTDFHPNIQEHSEKSSTVCLKLQLQCSLLPTISEDVDVAAQQAAERVLQPAVILSRLQSRAQGVLRSLKHLHGGLHRRKAGLHELGLSNVTACKTAGRAAGGSRDTHNRSKAIRITRVLWETVHWDVLFHSESQRRLKISSWSYKKTCLDLNVHESLHLL